MNESTKSPAFQFYPKDFLSDQKQISMSLAAVGIYMRLICHCWNEGSLPTDLVVLARLAGATKRQMTDIWPSIAPCFKTNDDGKLIHPRLEREREKQLLHRQRQSDRASARWEMARKLEQNRRKRHAVASGRHMPDACSTALPDACSSSSSASVQTGKEHQSGKNAHPAEKAPGPAEKAPGVREFLTWFQSEYKARRNGAMYFVKWEAHGAIVKRLLSAIPFERLQNHVRILLDERTADEWIANTDRGIEVLSAKINWLEERLAAWETKRKAREAV